MEENRVVTLEQFKQEAQARFGPPLMWQFVCPGCGHVASVQDYENAGAPEGAVGFSCIGRYLKTCRDWLGEEGPGPCNYTTGGLFNISPLTIIAEDGKEHIRFELASKESAP